MLGVKDDATNLDAKGTERHLQPQTINSVEKQIPAQKKIEPNFIRELR